MSKPTLLVMSRAVAEIAKPSAETYEILCLDDAPDRDAFLRERGGGIRAILAAGMERLDANRLALLPDLDLIAVVAAAMRASTSRPRRRATSPSPTPVASMPAMSPTTRLR